MDKVTQDRFYMELDREHKPIGNVIKKREYDSLPEWVKQFFIVLVEEEE